MSIHIRKDMPSQRAYAQAELNRFPLLFKCNEAGCVTGLACTDWEDAARQEQTHVCKIGGSAVDQPRFPVERNSEGGPGAIPKMWEAADAFFDRYSDTSIDPLEREAVKNQLTGMTVVIHLVMRPYYASRDDVVREIMARADARSRGEAPLTRGMGWISVCPEDGGSPFEAAVGGRGYTSDPKGMADPPFGYPQERVNEHRARLAMRPDDKASAPRVKADHTPPVGLVEKVEEIKQRSVAGFDNKLLAQAYSVTLSDIAWALKQ